MSTGLSTTPSPLPPPTKKYTHEICCADCGSQWWSQRSNAKVCTICRLVRNLAFIESRKAKCWMCDESYMRTDVNERVCSNCETRKGVYVDGECGVCDGSTHPLVHRDLRICTGCLRAPDRRREVMRALTIKKRYLQKNPVPTGYVAEEATV